MSKTINVAKVKDRINELVAKSTCSPDIRQGALNVLEWMLHETDNYNGYKFLEAADVPEGEKPGVVVNHQTNTHNFVGCDSTRVKYF
jgi:hypothetical protein